MYKSEAQVTTPICPIGPDCVYTEGVALGWRGLESVDVSFPFGHGLSYSAFAYAWVGTPVVAASTVGSTVSLTVTVTNSGSAPAREVAQVYVRSTEPLTILGAFQKTRVLQPAESVTLSFSLGAELFMNYDYGSGAFATMRPLSAYSLLVASSSRDTRLTHQLS